MKTTLVITRVWLIAVAALFLHGCAGMETAQTQPTPGGVVAERPKLVIGEAWQWTYGTEKFVGEEGNHLVFQYNITRKRYRTMDLNLVKTISRGGRVTQVRDPHSGFLNFPLFVGKRWSHSYDSNGVPRRISSKVTAYEQVTVRAGTFMAFRIEIEDQRPDREYPYLKTFWYSPQVKAVVKYEGVNGYTMETISKFELTKYSPAQ